jgi:hypothetical protein
LNGSTHSNNNLNNHPAFDSNSDGNDKNHTQFHLMTVTYPPQYKSEEKTNYDDSLPYFVPLDTSGLELTAESSFLEKIDKCVAAYEAFYNSKECSENIDVNIILPNEHAFYSILENVIRNAAKHHQKLFQTPEKNLEITIRLSRNEAETGFYKVEIFDNVSDFADDSKFNFFLKEYFQKDRPLEKEDSQYPSLGIRDMKICARILRGVNDSDLNSEDSNDYLEVSREEGRFLKYTFSLQAERRLCYIGNHHAAQPIDEEAAQKTG